MSIGQKISISTIVISLSLTTLAVFSFISIQNEVEEFGEFHTLALNSIQDLVLETAEAVEKGSAYVASGDLAKREEFLVWADQFENVARKFQSETKIHSSGGDVERELFETIVAAQFRLVEKAKVMFREFETSGSVRREVFSEYAGSVDELTIIFTRLLEIERTAAQLAQSSALQTIWRSQVLIIILALICVLLSYFGGLFITRSISTSVDKLKFAMLNVGDGDLDIGLDFETRDEFGELAASFSRMTNDLRKTESELHSTLEYMDNIIGSMTDSLVVVTPRGKIEKINQATCNLLGYREDEIVGRQLSMLFSDNKFRRLRSGDLSCLTRTGDSQIKYRSKDGREIPVSFSGSPIFSKSGETLGVVCVAQDITERKRAQSREREMKSRLEKAERMESLGLLAGGVAHDLNNMLGPIVGYPDLILRKLPDDSPVREQIMQMGKAASDASEVIQDLLTLARRGRFEPKPLNLNSVVKDYLNSPNFIDLSSRFNNIKVVTNLDENLASINGSSPHLSKVIMNLVVNAFEAMPDGGTIELNTSQEHLESLFSGFDVTKPGDYVILRVKDMGQGIEPEFVKKIFDPYFSRKKMGKSGSGLGLSVVYGIVKDHSGYYDVLTEIDKGTEFIFYFPVIREIAQETSASQKLLAGDQTMKLIVGGQTILVVDDEEPQRKMAFAILSSLGYKIETAANGHEALIYLSNKKVDVVVLDMIMEDGFDGLDTYREILKIHPRQKAIIVSGFSVTERVSQMQQLGAGAYVSKPYTSKQLARAIRAELDKQPGAISISVNS